VINRDDFWASARNKQLNFLQHIFTILKQHGRAVVVLPDNLLFFERKPAQEDPWTKQVWIYDLRTNLHFTLKENPPKRSDLDDFVNCTLVR
jgi:type I restriction enzyme M protein